MSFIKNYIKQILSKLYFRIKLSKDIKETSEIFDQLKVSTTFNQIMSFEYILGIQKYIYSIQKDITTGKPIDEEFIVDNRMFLYYLKNLLGIVKNYNKKYILTDYYKLIDKEYREICKIIERRSDSIKEYSDNFGNSQITMLLDELETNSNKVCNTYIVPDYLNNVCSVSELSNHTVNYSKLLRKLLSSEKINDTDKVIRECIFINALYSNIMNILEVANTSIDFSNYDSYISIYKQYAAELKSYIERVIDKHELSNAKLLDT